MAAGKRKVAGFALGDGGRAFTLPPVNSAPLGFFDSGVGGLTVVRAVQELLPAENIVYLGDTAPLPMLFRNKPLIAPK
jgi:hypothetical protein